MTHRLLTAAALAVALLADARPANGARHELPDNRATLVRRDGTHVALTLYINYADALRRALAPRQALGEFLVVASAMPLDEFRVALHKAQAMFRDRLRMERPDGTTLTLDHWSWPDAAQVQASLQRQAAETIVAPLDHTHEPPVEIRAEAVAPRALGAVHVRFPVEFQRVLVVWYTPQQAWAEPGNGVRVSF